MIYNPCNLPFWIIVLIYSLLTYISIKWLKTKKHIFIRRYLVFFCLLGLIILFKYKIDLIQDEEYLTVSGIGQETIFEELPLHLCNIVLWLTPIAIYANKKSVLSFCFFTSISAAPTALLFPVAGFLDVSIFEPRNVSYIITHFMVLSSGIYLYELDFYKPKLRDIPGFFVTTLIIAFIIHFMNLLLIRTGLGSNANYFFTVRPDNDILKTLYNYIPVNYLYMVPAFFGETLIAIAFVGMQEICRKMNDKKIRRASS